MASQLRVVHETEYRYDRPVTFGAHRLMLRPRDGHDMRVLETTLTITPFARLRWHFDPFGNSVADAIFGEMSDTLAIRSELLITRYPYDAVLQSPERQAIYLPVTYSPDECMDLAPFIALQYPDDRDTLKNWLNAVYGTRPVEVIAFLQGLSATINNVFNYSARDELGTQRISDTIANGYGTCRDFAFMFMEAARYFGFAARFVSGYLHDRAADGSTAAVGGGATHAWADVYIPGEGWIEFDPTNKITGGAELIRVAATRTPEQSSPINGTFSGNGAQFLGMDVSVEVTQLADGSSA